MKFTKEDARKRVLNCAKQYQQNLLHKKLLIIFRERQDNSIRFIEVIFHERNYQHLTGLELKGYSDFFVFQLSKTGIVALFYILSTLCLPLSGLFHEAINSNIFGYSIILRETTPAYTGKTFYATFLCFSVYAIALPEHENKKESPAHRSCTFI